jgi:two-component system, OmpR family, phosphate regulon sensor histidine kinase PhoR
MFWLWFLAILALLFFLASAWLGWRFFCLRHRLQTYSHTVRLAIENKESLSDLPQDEKGLEDLSNAVNSFALSGQERNRALETERSRLAAVLEQMTDGVLIADSMGIIQFANPAAGKLFGFAAPIGHTVPEVIRQYQFIQIWQRSRESGMPQEESLELPSHQFLHLEVLPDKSTGGSLLLVQNLTRVRRLETVRRDFISNVSHELRTPLASLKALTETLRDGALQDPKAAHRFLGRIEIEVDALTQMAQELLELTRIESGQVPLELKPVVPFEFLRSAADRMHEQVERAGLILRIEPVMDAPRIKADAQRLEQVLVNLIHNAVKFTRPGGEIVLSAMTEGDFVRFAVHDTGVGIPADDLERIFERFYKADRSRSGGGTGLGLSIARHIVEAHGGRIWVESVETRGSTFYFTVPVLKP